MSTDPSRYGNNWTQYYLEKAAIQAGIGDTADKVIERTVSGAIGIENTFKGTEQQRNGKDDSYSYEEGQDSGEFYI